MLILEEQFYKSVPKYLGDISKELKAMNEKMDLGNKPVVIADEELAKIKATGVEEFFDDAPSIIWGKMPEFLRDWILKKYSNN